MGIQLTNNQGFQVNAVRIRKLIAIPHQMLHNAGVSLKLCVRCPIIDDGTDFAAQEKRHTKVRVLEQVDNEYVGTRTYDISSPSKLRQFLTSW